MAVPYSNTKLRVPKGFQNILEGLARECLRSQPDDIFEFGAKYFEQLLQVREQTGHDPAIHGARLEDRFYNNDSFQSMSVDSSDPQQQEAALKIQTEVRRHQAAQEVDSMREEDAATKIQSGVRGHQDREKVADMKESSSEKANTTATSEEVDIDLNDPDVADAAIKIQAGFKGYKARKEVKEKKEAHSAKSEPLAPTEATEAELNEAASRIQAGFRGHKTRQEIKSMQNQSSESEKEENAEQPEDQEIDLDLNDPDLNEAAIRIQAGFRGHQARMEVKNQMASETKVEGKDNTEEEEVDIDLNDPEVANAAIKIQAGFKGYKARKEVLEMKSEEVPPSETEAKKEETTPEKEGADKSEEIDIDLNDPEVEKAAVKIQASFKGYQTRKSTKDSKEGVKSDESMETPKQEEAKQEEEVDIDLKDPDTEQAALKIQAGFRGYKTRKEVKEKMEEAKSSEKQDEEKTEEKPEEKTEEKQEETTEAKPEESKTGEEIDIDLNDPEVEKAATKIQAGFKGYKVRKEVKDKQGEKTTETEEAKPSESKEEVDIDLQDPEVEKAATKIQAGFKGYKTRKEVKEKMDSQKDEGQE